MSKIITKAKKFGTFVSPTTGGILYVDPKHASEAHHSPELDEAEAKVAFERGLIEDPAGATAAEFVDPTNLDPNGLSQVAASRTAEGAEALGQAAGAGEGEDGKEGEGKADGVGEGATGNESRQSTAWPDAERVLGGASGHVQSEMNDAAAGATAAESGDDNDADAAPAPKPAKRPPPPQKK